MSSISLPGCKWLQGMRMSKRFAGPRLWTSWAPQWKDEFFWRWEFRFDVDLILLFFKKERSGVVCWIVLWVIGFISQDTSSEKSVLARLGDFMEMISLHLFVFFAVWCKKPLKPTPLWLVSLTSKTYVSVCKGYVPIADTPATQQLQWFVP